MDAREFLANSDNLFPRARGPSSFVGFGVLWALLLLLAPAVLAVWSANHFAEWLDPWMEASVKQCVDWFGVLPGPLKDVAIGKYGLITMGPLLFVWAVPTVLVYALIAGAYKASGLLDRITVALHPAVHGVKNFDKSILNRVVKESSDSGVELEQAAESVATANGPAFRRYVWRREEEKIALALVVPFRMMMIDVLDQRAT